MINNYNIIEITLIHPMNMQLKRLKTQGVKYVRTCMHTHVCTYNQFTCKCTDILCHKNTTQEVVKVRMLVFTVSQDERVKLPICFGNSFEGHWTSSWPPLSTQTGQTMQTQRRHITSYLSQS
jgi:hypothetical protein